MTPDELAAVEARANAATPGPWLWHDDDLWHGMTADALDAYNADPTGNTAPDPFDGKNTEDFSISWGDIIRPEDGKFIAAARQDVPALVDEVRRLRAALADAHEGMGDMISYVPAIFREKWEHDAYLARARQALRTAGVEAPS